MLCFRKTFEIWYPPSSETLVFPLSDIGNPKPVPAAKVFIDGTEAGATDNGGNFLHKLSKLPGTEVHVTVEKEAAGYRVEPWKESFVTKLGQPGTVERYRFTMRKLMGMLAAP